MERKYREKTSKSSLRHENLGQITLPPEQNLGHLCYSVRFAGGVPEWLKGADCKSVGLRLHWFESSPLHQRKVKKVLA